MDLTNERTVGLKEEEKLEMQLVEPLTELQLLEDIEEDTSVGYVGSRDTTRHILESTHHIHTHVQRNKTQLAVS